VLYPLLRLRQVDEFRFNFRLDSGSSRSGIKYRLVVFELYSLSRPRVDGGPITIVIYLEFPLSGVLQIAFGTYLAQAVLKKESKLTTVHGP
jgi:hypothetical protein